MLGAARMGLIGGVALAALTLSASSYNENAASGTTIGAITGKTAGSTLSLVNDAGGRVSLSGANLTVGSTNSDYEALVRTNTLPPYTVGGANYNNANTTSSAGDTSPLGATAILLTTTNTLEGGPRRSSAGMQPNTTYVLSAIAKAGTITSFFLRNLALTGNQAAQSAYFNLATGAPGTKGSSVIASGMIALANGFYLCWMTGTTPASLAGDLVDIKFDGGAAGRTIQLAQFDLQAGSSYQAPIVTTSTTPVTAARLAPIVRETLDGVTRDTMLVLNVGDLTEYSSWNPADTNTAVGNGAYGPYSSVALGNNTFVRSLAERSDTAGGNWYAEFTIGNDADTFNSYIGVVLSSASMPGDMTANSSLAINILGGAVTYNGSSQTGLGGLVAGDKVYIRYNPDGGGTNGLIHYGKVGGADNLVGAASAGPFKLAAAVIGSAGSGMQILLNGGGDAFSGTLSPSSPWGAA